MAAAVGMTAGERERGTAYGLFMACFSLGFVAIPPLGGLLGDVSALSPFAAAAVSCVLGATVVAVMRTRLRRDKAGPPTTHR